MTRKLFGGLLALALMAGAFFSWATVLPLPSGWTMYSVGPYLSTSATPFKESQADAADAYFQFYVVGPAPTKGCYRYFWGPSRSGPYTDKAWKDKAWYDCQFTGTAYTYTNSDVNIAPAINCTPSTSIARCYLVGSAANAKNIGCPTCNGSEHADGIDVGTGNKYQAEADFEVPGSPLLNFTRSYNNNSSVALGISTGAYWRHSFDYKLVKNTSGKLDLYRPDGSTKRFSASMGADADETGILDVVLDGQGTQTGWTFDTLKGQVETYDMRGRIQRVDLQQGGYLVYTYASSTTDVPATVGDHLGRALTFTYDTSNRLTKVKTPGGADYVYAYSSNLLTSVTKPGGAVRKYVYDETANDATGSLPGQLTGIVDESNTRFATFKYDKYNRATSSERAGGTGKFTVAYANDGVTNTVSSPLAAARQFTFTNLLSIMRGTGSTTTCTDGSCGQVGASTYDSRGNKTSLVGDNGVKACFAYDIGRNLLVRQVDGLAVNADCSAALSSPPAGTRVTSIDWHSYFDKPIAISVPLKVSTMVYDSAQRATSVSEVPTADTTGAHGTSAAATGSARTMAYGYNGAGQLTSISGPRPGQVTSYEYDVSGNMFKATNPAGQVTLYGSFDGDGRPWSVTLPSGAMASLQYNARGDLTSMMVEGESTTLGYNGMGILTSVALPNGETLTYGYDTAQRLTSVTDSRGQKVTYALNAAGQPTTQQVLNANSSVAVSATRVFDMLGRLKQVTGAQRL